MWEKEKLLGTSNFSFSHTVFKSLALQTRENQGLCGKGLRQALQSMTSSYAKNSKTWPNENVLDRYFLTNSIEWIQLCDKKNLTFVDCCDKIVFNSYCKMLLSLPKARLVTFSKTRLIKIYLNS